MKVIYLTWGETPRSSGVYGSQVVSQLKNIYKLNDVEIVLLAGLPILHSGLVREKNKYKLETKKIAENIHPIKFKKITIFMPQNFINDPIFGFHLLHLQSNKKLIKFINKYKPDIIHCRSYHAAYAAIKAKKYAENKYKIIFDARGLWPEQYAVSKSKNSSDYAYKKLKSIEYNILYNSDLTVSVSETMTRHYQKLGIQKEKLLTIYPSCPNHDEFEEKDTSKLTLCYLGALNENTWHKPSELSKLFNYLLSLHKGFSLKIITKDNHNEIKKFFTKDQLGKITFSVSNNVTELKEHLKDVNIGILSYFIPSTELECIFADTVMAIKTGEYLSSGLPVLINEYCGGAAHYVEKNSIGIPYNPNNFNEITLLYIKSLLTVEKNKLAINLSEKDFSYSNNARRYKEAYEAIM